MVYIYIYVWKMNIVLTGIFDSSINGPCFHSYVSHYQARQTMKHWGLTIIGTPELSTFGHVKKKGNQWFGVSLFQTIPYVGEALAVSLCG